MKVTAMVGSLRKLSYNRQLADTIRERHRDKFALTVADIRSLPLFDQDEEEDAPQAVRELRREIAGADGVMLFTPEYNWSVPGALKNALDWLSRVDKVMIGKPVMIAGVSTGPMGTIRAQLHLREVLAGMRAKLLPPAGNEILIGSAAQKFDAAAGRLTDETTLRFVDEVVGRFVEFAQASR